MAYSLITHGGATTDSGRATSPTLNTTGANLIIIGTGAFTSASLSDNKSNTWTPLTAYSGASSLIGQLYYCYAPTVGSGHIFEVLGSFPSITVVAFSGAASSPFDQENGAGSASGSTHQPGSVTPSQANELLVCMNASHFQDVTGIDSSFTLLDHGPNTGATAYAIAYKIQTSAGAENPTYTYATGDINMVNAIATFKASGGGGNSSSVSPSVSPSASVSPSSSSSPSVSPSASVSPSSSISKSPSPSASVSPSASASPSSSASLSVSPSSSVSRSVSPSASVSPSSSTSLSVSPSSSTSSSISPSPSSGEELVPVALLILQAVKRSNTY